MGLWRLRPAGPAGCSANGGEVYDKVSPAEHRCRKLAQLMWTFDSARQLARILPLVSSSAIPESVRPSTSAAGSAAAVLSQGAFASLLQGAALAQRTDPDARSESCLSLEA